MNPSDPEIFALLDGAATVAMVGASATPARPSYGVMERLLRAGYRVIPVNPNVGRVHGIASVPSLSEVRGPIDIVNVFRRPEHAPALAEQAVAFGARALWLQQDIVSEPAAQLARAGGLLVVMDLCIAVMHSVLGVPNKVRH